MEERIMKKISIILAAAVLVSAAASCAKEELPAASEKTLCENLVATATIPATKVSLSEDSSTHNIKGTWEVNDVVFGFVEGGANVSFCVSAVDATSGVATLQQTTNVSLYNGDKLHLIYATGKTASDLVDGALSMDFSTQTPDVVPVLMTADATIASNAVTFNFKNAVSILSIADITSSMKADGRTMKKLVLSGHEIISAGAVSLVDGALSFTADAPSKFIEKDLTGFSFDDIDGTNSKIPGPIYVTLPAGKVERLTVVDSKGYIRSLLLNQTAVAGKHYSIKGKTLESITLPTAAKAKPAGLTFADRNLGATTNSGTGIGARGDIYQWAGTELIYTDLTTSPITFKPTWSDTGFKAHEGTIYYNGSKYTKYCKADGKRTLDPVDDIVQLTYPGSGWMIPSEDDINAVLEAITAGTVKVSFGSKRTTWTVDDQTMTILRDKIESDGTTLSITGKYWTSTVYADADNIFNRAVCFQFNSSGVLSTATGNYRGTGLSILPIKKK